MEEFKGISTYTINPTHGYRKLFVFQKAKELVLLTYKITVKYPSNETYALVSQMRRAVVSVLANIVEGYSKSSKKEYVRFLDISIGSIAELEVYYELSLELCYINKLELNRVLNLILEIKKLLYSYQKSLRIKSRVT